MTDKKENIQKALEVYGLNGEELDLPSKIDILAKQNQVIFEDGKTKEKILYNQLTKIFEIGKGNEVAVLGNKLQIFLTTLTGIFTSHTHPYVDTPVGPSVTSVPAKGQDAPTDILSKKIKIE